MSAAEHMLIPADRKPLHIRRTWSYITKYLEILAAEKIADDARRAASKGQRGAYTHNNTPYDDMGSGPQQWKLK